MTRTRALIGMLAALAVVAGCGTTAKTGVDGQPAGTSVPPQATTAGAEAPANRSLSPTSCLASVQEPSPAAGDREVVFVQTAAGATVESTQHYPGGAETYDDTADSAGAASVPFTVPDGLSGQRIAVTVRTTYGQSCSTSFTPR